MTQVCTLVLVESMRLSLVSSGGSNKQAFVCFAWVGPFAGCSGVFPNVLRRWRLCQQLVCGDLSAFGAGVVTDSVRLCSGWFPVLLR